jgi:hypothetical protein
MRLSLDQHRVFHTLLCSCLTAAWVGVLTFSPLGGQTPTDNEHGAAPSGRALAIVNAGLESAEDAPFIRPDYKFNPGDFVYVVFEIAGYKTAAPTEYNGPRHMSLKYTVEPLDEKGASLAAIQKAEIEQDIGPEDKNWLPKRRASFLLPPYVAAGTYHVKLRVEDSVAKSNQEKDLSFTIGGVNVTPGPDLQVQVFRFQRSDQDGPALDPASYRAGDTVWARFVMTGFKLGPENAVDLSYGVTVRRPNGKSLFDQESAAEQRIRGEFYPPQFVPGSLSVTTTKDLAPGEYKLTVHVRDLIGKQSIDFEQSFRVE